MIEPSRATDDLAGCSPITLVGRYPFVTPSDGTPTTTTATTTTRAGEVKHPAGEVKLPADEVKHAAPAEAAPPTSHPPTPLCDSASASASISAGTVTDTSMGGASLSVPREETQTCTSAVEVQTCTSATQHAAALAPLPPPPPPPPAVQWPPLALLHGTADRTVDWHHSKDFAAALRVAGARDVVERYFEHKSHTDPVIEDPLLGCGTCGRADPLVETVLELVFGRPTAGAAPTPEGSAEAASTADGSAQDRGARESMPMGVLERATAQARRRATRSVTRLAKWINPF